MQDTRAPVSQTAVTGQLQTSRFTKTVLLSTTELRFDGSLVRRRGSTAQPPRSCAVSFRVKVGTNCGSHTQNVPHAHIWSRFYNLWSHGFYDGNVGIRLRRKCQKCWTSHDFCNRAIVLHWGCYLGYWCNFFGFGSNCGADFDSCACSTPIVAIGCW